MTGEEFQNAKMDLLKLSARLCFSRFGRILKCFDVRRHKVASCFWPAIPWDRLGW